MLDLSCVLCRRILANRTVQHLQDRWFAISSKGPPVLQSSAFGNKPTISWRSLGFAGGDSGGAANSSAGASAGPSASQGEKARTEDKDGRSGRKGKRKGLGGRRHGKEGNRSGTPAESGVRRDRIGSWSRDEHSCFMTGLRRCGWGRWDEIAASFVGSRSAEQVHLTFFLAPRPCRCNLHQLGIDFGRFLVPQHHAAQDSRHGVHRRPAWTLELYPRS